MHALLRGMRQIDALTERTGHAVRWLVLAAALVSAGNAVLRHVFGVGSNAGLELQWYLFGAVFLLGSGYTLKHRGHVRIDLIHGRLSQRSQWWIEVFGTLLFLLPFCAVMIDLSWPMFVEAWQSGEMSPDAGGLPRWPVKLLIPAGFALLALQGVAELLRNLGYLSGALSSDDGESR